MASQERTGTAEASGSCGRGSAARLNPAIAPGRNTRQCVEPPNWKKPSSSPLATWCPGFTCSSITQDETSDIPIATKAVVPITGSSASMMKIARAATWAV